MRLGDRAGLRRRAGRRRLSAVVLLAVLGLVAACATPLPPPHTTLRVLASSELADMGPLLDDLRRETGIELVMEHRGTIDATNALNPGDYRHDIAWLSTDRYFELKLKQIGFTGERPISSRFMFSPLAIGVKPAVAELLRATTTDQHLSWADLADLSAMGMVRFGMADPKHASSALSALIGVATAAAGTGGALREEDISCDRLRGFFAGRTLTGDTSRRLADSYAANQDDADALINYESVLLSLNASGKLREPLEILYPRDGIVLADYPMLLLDPAKRDSYEAVVNWFKSEQGQRKIMERTLRRPLDSQVPRDPRFGEFSTNTLYFPERKETIDRLAAEYSRPQSRDPSHVIFVLDFSASMSGPRIAALRSAFAGFSGADPSAVGKFVRFYKGEMVTIMRFGGHVLDERDFTITGQADLKAVQDYIAADRFDQTTGVWSALEAAYAKAAAATRDHPEQPVTIMLMTDGENNAGISLQDFLRNHQARDPAAKAVHTYTVRFGEANPGELDQAARATGGRMVDANATSLSEAFKEIRGCR
ncbi:substrate-binding domain-containing protein [Saccharopolyspora spinosporotrichia]|uniref:Substrate-binding domain-containing protein n=2 Tax=Saccharopolyspora erythraea TaxID=1836 RepID=A0ABP3NUN9_SACER|nr:VWA domain-containing protein [Saccharopolyspora erythraea]